MAATSEAVFPSTCWRTFTDQKTRGCVPRHARSLNFLIRVFNEKPVRTSQLARLISEGRRGLLLSGVVSPRVKGCEARGEEGRRPSIACAGMLILIVPPHTGSYLVNTCRHHWGGQQAGIDPGPFVR